MHPFRQAVEARDLDAMVAQLADDVVFRSPVVYRPYEGKEALAAILSAVMRVFEDFSYERELSDGRDHLLLFKARVGDREVEGCDILRTGEDGLITDFRVMLRPLSGTLAFAELMRAEVEAAGA